MCGGGGMVVEADHDEDLWCGFVHSLPDQENREAQKAGDYSSQCLPLMVCPSAKHHVLKFP